MWLGVTLWPPARLPNVDEGIYWNGFGSERNPTTWPDSVHRFGHDAISPAYGRT